MYNTPARLPFGSMAKRKVRRAEGNGVSRGRGFIGVRLDPELLARVQSKARKIDPDLTVSILVRRLLRQWEAAA
jgi:hypothetical protein